MQGNRSRLLPVACLLVAACATGAGARGEQDDRPAAATATVHVENDLLPRQEVTVRLIRPDGTREILGSVSPGRSRAFTLREASFAGSFALVAQNDSGQNVVSRPFTMYANDQVVWEIRLNQLTVGR